MESKVYHSLELVKANPGLEVSIFSGEEMGIVKGALLGSQEGTLISGNAAGSSPS
jgi:hypothetical protein